jgi:hypothetical protein
MRLARGRRSASYRRSGHGAQRLVADKSAESQFFEGAHAVRRDQDRGARLAEPAGPLAQHHLVPAPGQAHGRRYPA